MQVTVPDGVGPGDEFDIETDGVLYRIVCPDYVCSGDPLELDFHDPAAAAHPPLSVDVTVPEGVGPGQHSRVESVHC